MRHTEHAPDSHRANTNLGPRPPGQRIARPRILLPSVPWPMRRMAGAWLLGLTLWMASILALFR